MILLFEDCLLGCVGFLGEFGVWGKSIWHAAPKMIECENGMVRSRKEVGQRGKLHHLSEGEVSPHKNDVYSRLASIALIVFVRSPGISFSQTVKSPPRNKSHP